jgi:type I restriction enzyme, R subunit
MSEYALVEKPFLDQISALGWQVIDHGEGVPQDPTISLRTGFREVALKGVFCETVRRINRLPDGREWLTDAQLDNLFDQVTGLNGKLLEVNQAVFEILTQNRAIVARNELTGEASPTVRLVDWDNWGNNVFHAINQFRIDTPGRVKDHIRPDIVLFVNGLPFAIVECKDANSFTSNPIEEAIEQLTRYANQRSSTHDAGLVEGEERLFHTNQLMIVSCGSDARYGTISSAPEHYLAWKAIYPETYADYTKPLGDERAQEKLIQGMLAPETLLDIVRHFTLFMDVGDTRIKTVCRYQQYRAVGRVLARLRAGKTPEERSGVVWHTQGSGKSLTMVFLIRKLRTQPDQKDLKVLMVNDRTDLEDQLGKTASLTGEKPQFIDSAQALKTKLAGTESNLNMVMIHKFRENQSKVAGYVADALGQEVVERFGEFGLVNNSGRILVLIDEAHRTQYSDLGDNLFMAFPNAARIAFTGTPLLTERHDQRTHERFGSYIDKYRLQDAVDDGATVQILYEGRTADTAIYDKSGFDTKFEDLFRERSEEELAAIKQKYGATGDIFEAEGRIEEIARDLVRHYIEQILPDGFKAQVVASSKLAAIHYKTYIDAAIAKYLENLQAAAEPDAELMAKVAFLKSAVVVSSDGTNELAIVTETRKQAKEINAVESFCKKFDPAKPETGVAFLIVCDMLLTGFDAPIEQVMYIDKKLREHTLLQAIARVNRTAKGKQRGYIVDYIGLASHLKQALSLYGADEQKELLEGLKNVADEVPLLEQRFNRLLQLFADNRIAEANDFFQQDIHDIKQEWAVLERMVDLLGNEKLRADFEVYLKKFLESLNTILPSPLGNPYRIPAKRLGYLHAKVKERYKDNSLNLAGAGEKVRKLINDHLISLGINPKIPPVELFSEQFIKQLEKHQSPRAKASEMEHAIRKHLKVHEQEDPAFYGPLSEKLEGLIQQHKDNWQLLYDDLFTLRETALAGRKTEASGDDPKIAPFTDLIKQISFGKSAISAQQQATVSDLGIELHRTLQVHLARVGWEMPAEQKKLRSELTDLFINTGDDQLIAACAQLAAEVMQLASHRRNDLLS